MKAKEYYGLVEKRSLHRIVVSQEKSHDYATGDVLSNFKRLAEAAGAIDIDVATPHGYALFMVLLKLDRLNNLMKNHKAPKNESIEDTVIDAQNYLDLAEACYREAFTLPDPSKYRERFEEEIKGL